MKKYNILIADDSYLNRLLLRRFIEDLSDNIAEAENGLEAITVHHTQNIDLILMDINMPIMNGVEAAKHIRKEMSSPKNRVPIIAVSACDPKKFESNFLDDFIDAQFDQYLCKPVSKELIVQEISSLLNITKEISSPGRFKRI